MACAAFVSGKWQIKVKYPALKSPLGKTMTDPIADMINRIKNSQAVLKPTVAIPFSKIKYEIAKILEKEKIIEKAEKRGKAPRKTIEIILKNPPLFSNFKRVSKPGQRIYLPAKKIKKVRGGYGLAVISTSRGLMTDSEARKKKIGGEIICEIW